MNGLTLASLPVGKDFDGEVEFKFDVNHSSFGKIHINSKFKRLKPVFERGEVSKEEINLLKSELMAWITPHFDISGREKYFDELAIATTRFSVYVNPFSALDGRAMGISIKIFFWLWFNDDELESAIEHEIPFQSLKEGCDQLKDVWKGKYDDEKVQFKSVPNYSFFDQMFHSLLDIHRMCQKEIPDYSKAIGPSRYLLHRYFEAQRWFSVDCIDNRYSESSFGIWRRIIAYFDGISEVIALVEGVRLPHHIRTSPSFQRMLDVANAVGGFVNDLLGMNKEFGNGQTDNIIIFKSLQKNIPLKQAVNEVCCLLDLELEDFFLMKNVVLKEFSNEPNLIKYVHILESLIDGHNRIYLESPRHRSTGCVQLSRN